MSDSEFDSNGGLDAAWKASAVEATVPPTAGEMIAQWVREVEGTLDNSNMFDLSMTEHQMFDYLSGTRARLRRILDAIHAST